MAIYTFKCTNKKCKTVVESCQSIKDYQPLITCPTCKKDTLVRDYESDLPSGSVKRGDHQITVGELAKRNTERFSEDYKEHLHNKNYAYRENPPPFKEPKAKRKMRELREFASGLTKTGAKKCPQKKK